MSGSVPLHFYIAEGNVRKMRHCLRTAPHRSLPLRSLYYFMSGGIQWLRCKTHLTPVIDTAAERRGCPSEIVRNVGLRLLKSEEQWVSALKKCFCVQEGCCAGYVMMGRTQQPLQSGGLHATTRRGDHLLSFILSSRD
jgi:hypothetical protein